MASFLADRDLDRFDASEDVTAGSPPPAHNTTATRVASPSVSPRKRTRIADTTNAKENESLMKRMGGPSAAKAGLGKDQEEINRIIFEASKGSKYFENERRNDERITAKIQAILDVMGERLRAVPEHSFEWSNIEKKAEAMAAKVETQRELGRLIVHCDLDMFYAAVELKRDPSLKGKAFGVGKGVLVTASYEARRFGVRSGMASHIAYALCPHLITVPNNMEQYVLASRQVMEIFRCFDSNLAQASLDEAYLDITSYCRQNDVSADEAVADLRAQIRDETGLTVSVGVAPNKMLAKIGSDKNKPDGQFRIEPNREACIGFTRDLPIRKVPGVGRVTERTLQALGVHTCGDIWTLRVRIALALGDSQLEWLLHYYLGIASAVVEPGKREERKSVGREHTFKPTSDPESLFKLLREATESVEDDLKKLDFVGKKVTLIGKGDDFQRFTRDQTQTSYVSSADDIYRVVSALLEHELRQHPGLTLRLIGARVGTLKDVRKPADGGPLQRLWAQGPERTRSRSKRPDGSLADDDADLDEDEESKQLRLAIAASLQDLQAKEAAAPLPPGDNPSVSEEQDQPLTEGFTEDWDLAPPEERSASKFAEALRRSTPEVLRPATKKRSTAEPTEEELEAAVLEKQESASRTAPSRSVQAAIPAAKGWFGTVEGADAQENPVCPICSQTVAVRFGSTLAGRNAQINQHIDACLKGSSSSESREDAASRSTSEHDSTQGQRNKAAKGPRPSSASKKERSGSTLKRFFGK